MLIPNTKRFGLWPVYFDPSVARKRIRSSLRTSPLMCVTGGSVTKFAFTLRSRSLKKSLRLSSPGPRTGKHVIAKSANLSHLVKEPEVVIIA